MDQKTVLGIELGSTVQPDGETTKGFDAYMKRYRALLDVERSAVEVL